jgi:hypothetical protein
LAKRSTSTPFMSGIWMSEISRSIGLCSSSAIAWRPFSASTTS